MERTHGVDAPAMTGVGAGDPSRVFGPAAEVGTLWLEELRRRSGVASLAWSDATSITNWVLEHLAARLDGRADGDAEELLHVAPLLDIDDVVALRSVFRARASDRLSVEAAMPLLHVADELIDDLLRAIVRAKVDALESAAFMDPLTGAGNRRALTRDIDRELARSFRHSRPVCIVAIDVDGLKGINDTQGHAAGDEALRRLALALTESLRVGDSVYRVGGDEFVVLLPETAAEDVQSLLERATVRAPTFSYGVACAPDDATNGDALLSYADAQLMEGRRQRRQPGVPVEPVLDLTDGGPNAPQAAPAAGDDGALATTNRYGTPRLAISQIVVGVSDRVFTAEVTMRGDAGTVVGRASGSSAGVAGKHIVAMAVIDAAATVDPTLGSSFIDGISVFRVADTDVAVVNIVVVGDAELTTIGAAAVRERGAFDAVARAAMDALNRRLAMGQRAVAGRSGG